LLGDCHDAMPESTRRQIGKYRIQTELGRGGFGVVYSAYDPTVGRPVAVKVLTVLGDAQLLTRFKNEAAAAGNLRHKNIVTIYDYGDDDGLPYIVMELLEGEDLNQIIAARKPMSLLQKVSIMVQVADGLRSAHRAGVVHRDIKPGNIRLLPDGTVKLMDFGIARLLAGSAGTRLTRQGHVIGTLSYMAPEQILGEEVDALSDIFAYGSTYYELLTGKHPFQGSDPRSVFHKITAEDPEPIRNLVPDCPEALEQIVNRTLQKDRDLRYQSLRDVQVDTEPILVELRQERAGLLVAEARRIYAAGDLENAQAVLGEVFDLDPANREARQLRETIQGQLLSRLIRPKIDALVRKADDALSARQYEDAIESFEAAFRLDRENQAVSGKLEQARRLLTLSREVARLIADARRHFSKQNLEGALEILLQVLERESAHPEAQRLFDEVRAALTRREKERQYQDKLQQAKDLLQANSFDESAKLLEDLDSEFKTSEEARNLAAEIRSRKGIFERQQQLNAEIAAVRELLASAQFEAAIKKVELLMKRFPGEVEPTSLFILSHRELAAYRKTQALEKLGSELNRLMGSGHFERALRLVGQSLKTYPSEPGLLEAQRRVEAEWAHHKREAAILQLLEESVRYSAHHDLEKAVQVLEAAVQQYAGDPRLAESLTSTRAVLAAKRREEALVSLLQQAQAQQDRREYQQALDSLGSGLAEYGADERLTGLREKIVAAKAAWECAEGIREIVEQSRQLVAHNELEAALEQLQSGLRQFPDELPLTQALVATQDALAARRREEGIVNLLRQGQAQLDECQYQPALAAIDCGLAEYGDDRRLTGLREQVASAQAQWERAEAVRQAIESAQNSVAQQNFSTAIALLESAVERYPGESQLEEALASARNALAAKRRDEAIEALCGKAQAQIDNRDFPHALAAVDRGMTAYGNDSRLERMREKVLSAQAAWERAETIRQTVADAQKYLTQGRPESALEALASASRRYTNEPGLLAASVVAQQALAAQRREQAVEALVRQAQERLQAGAYQDALELLVRGLADYDGDRRLIDLRATIESAKAAWERAAAIAQLAEDSRQHVAEREFEKAIALLESALSQYPGEPQLVQAMDVARAELAARQRDEAIEEACRLARGQLEASEYQDALNLVDQAVTEYGNDRRFTAVRDRIVSAKAQWERAEAVRQLVEAAHNFVAQQDFNQAIALLESALKSYPGEPRLTEALTAARAALAARRRNEAIETICGQAHAQIEKNDFTPALKIVDRGLTGYRGDQRLAALREKILTAAAEWERNQAVRLIIEDAQKRLAQVEPQIAVESLEAALRQHPADGQLTEALNTARTALGSLRRKTAIEALLRQAQRDLQSREFGRALEALDRGLAEYGEDRRLSDLREKALSAKADWERAESLRELLNEARRQIAAGQPESALELLESARSQYGDELQPTLAAAQEAIAAKQKEQAIEAACRSAHTLLNERQYAPALDTLAAASDALGKDPRLSAIRDKVSAAKEEWERAQAIRQLLEDSRRRVSENDLQGALELLTQALGSYPGEPSLVKALAETREAIQVAQKETAIAALSRETRLFMGTQDFPTALAMVERGLKTYGQETRLTDLRKTVLAAQADWQRRRALGRAVDAANNLIAQRAPDRARRVLEEALQSYPGDPLLLDALVAARDAVELKQREESLEKIYSEACQQLDRGKFDAALQQLERGLKESPEDRRLLELRDNISAVKTEAQRVADEIKSIVQSAQTLSERGEREEATALLERALTKYPANPELVAAIVGTIEAVAAAGTEAIDKICRNARQLMLTGNFDLAFHTLERALRLQDEEQQTAIQELPRKTRTEAAMAAAAGTGLHRDASPAASVKEVTGEHDLFDDFSQPPSDEIPIAGEYRDPPAAVLNAAVADKAVSQPVLRRAATWLAPGNRWLIIGLAAAALLFLASIVVINLVRTPKLAVLAIRISPAGATVRVNDQACSTPTCEFHLHPGQYRLQASAPGYREITETATLRLGSSESPRVIALEPLSPTICITANFADGDIVLDNRRAGPMQGGQFVVERLTPGRHNLRISGREVTASISFDADYGRLPAFTNVSQQNSDVLASGSFGNRAVVACSGCSGTVSIDERQVGELKDGVITIENVAPGTHRVKVGSEHSLVFSTGGAPAINLAVNSNRNFGALMVETSEDNATVFVDGNKYPRPTSRGQLLIPAEARQHTIRVAKDGYRADPPEIIAQLRKGDQFQARFKLIAEPARLSVSHQPVGAAVLIDGSPVGKVGSDGAFSAQVPAGDHRIEFRKDGYVTAQVQRSFEPGRRLTVSQADAPLVAKAVTPLPAGPEIPAASPNATEQVDWQRIAETQTVAQLEEFLRSHPAGVHREEAQARLKELRQQQANAAREETWNAIDKNNKAALQQFLSKYGDGPHAQDARTMLAAIEKQEAEELAVAQRAKEQASSNAADSTAILHTLSQFESAYNRKDLPALQGLWSGMPKNIVESYRNQFRDAKSLDFRLSPAGQTEVSGNTATATCTRTLRFTARNGEHPPGSNERVRVTLDRAGSQWVIRTITPF
jgi:hypothetical protein